VTWITTETATKRLPLKELLVTVAQSQALAPHLANLSMTTCGQQRRRKPSDRHEITDAPAIARFRLPGSPSQEARSAC